LRKLSEIPVNEVAELVRLKSRFSRGAVNQNRQFQIIIDSYQIPQSELHLVGAVLDDEWKALLS
jgi:formiminotetrahydrofolate cyclodeaminase